MKRKTFVPLLASLNFIDRFSKEFVTQNRIPIYIYLGGKLFSFQNTTHIRLVTLKYVDQLEAVCVCFCQALGPEEVVREPRCLLFIYKRCEHLCYVCCSIPITVHFIPYIRRFNYIHLYSEFFVRVSFNIMLRIAQKINTYDIKSPPAPRTHTIIIVKNSPKFPVFPLQLAMCVFV